MNTLVEAAARIASVERLLLTCHLGPDGDSLGSMSSLAALLRERGKDVTLYNPDGVPRALRFLPGTDTLVRTLRADARFDLTVVVDCGDRKLLGERFPAAEVTGPLLVLDHHSATRPFGDLYVCDPGASSVGVLVARIAAENGWEISPAAAVGIYVSLVADTGSFRYSNTNTEAFRLAALLLERGVDPWAVAEKLGEEQPLARYRLLGAALSAIRLELDGRVAVMVVTEEMVRGAGARWDHVDGLVNYARAIEGVECGVLVTPSRETGTRASLRSKGRLDVGAVCAAFGGGGHRAAAGCVIAAPIDQARALLLDALAAAFGPVA